MPDSKPMKSYKVVKGTVGPWPFGHVFSEAEFKRLHPPAKLDADGEPTKQEAKDAYHAEALGRLIALKVVEPTEEPAAETPPGPGSEPPKPVLSQAEMIAKATRDSLKEVIGGPAPSKK